MQALKKYYIKLTITYPEMPQAVDRDNFRVNLSPKSEFHRVG